MQTIDILTQNTVAAFLLSVLAFCLAMLITPIFTYFAYKYKWWKIERSHDATGKALTVINKLNIKRNVPIMAGVIVIGAVTIVTATLNLDRAQTWLPLAALIGGGAIGLIDDIINIRGKGGKVAGLRPRVKFIMITTIAGLAALFFYYRLGYDSIHIPVIGDLVLGWWLIPLFILVVVSTSNAVNISDGLDGLAGGLLISSYGAFSVIALLQGNYGIAAFCLTVIGALIAYLWFNIPPARFFMGDVGSFSLGMALGVVAMMTNSLVLLPIIGLVFVLEAGSSLLQILSKRFLHRRVFIAAPIHHHFNALGWEKTKITMRFWLVGQICAVIGIILALVGGYI